MKKLSVLCFSLIFASSMAFAQCLYEVPLAQRIENAGLIIEGKVLNSTSFEAEDGSMIYTSHEVLVQTLLKGQAPEATVTVVTPGGTIANRTVDVTPSAILNPHEEGVFFLMKTTKFKELDNPVSYTFYAGPQGFVWYHHDRYNPPATDIFSGYNKVDLEVIQTIEKITGQPRVRLAPKAGDERLRKWLGLRGIESNSLLDYGIEYTFENVQFGGQEVSFDVLAQTTNGFTYEYGNADIVLEYDTVGFLSNIVAGGVITVTKDDVTASSDYTLSVTDEQPDKVKIEITAASQPIALGTIDGQGDEILHVSIDISQITQQVEVNLDELLMDGETEYYDTTLQAYFSFPYVLASDSVEMISSAAAPQIMNFTPDTLPAGALNNSFLTIIGANFDTVKGHVLFRNPDDFGTSWHYINQDDIVGWADNLIVLTVPSLDSSSRSPMASGNFIVENADGTDTSGRPLYIPYAVTNRPFTIGGRGFKEPVNIVDKNGAGGLSLFFHSSMDSAARVVFTAALDVWRCNTQINFVIDTMESPTDSINIGDNMSTISFDSLPAGINAQTLRNIENCTAGNRAKFWLTEFDMVFSLRRPWHIDTDTAGIAATERDFFSTALHELGHGHLLEHTLPGDKQMYGFGTNGLAGVRRELTGFDVQGGNYVVGRSTNAITCNDPNNSQMAMTRYICTGLGLEVLSGDQFSIYPNPAQSQFTVRSEDRGLQTVSLLNIQGQVVQEWTWKAGTTEATFELSSSISKGYYLIALTTQNGRYASPIIISE